MRWVTSSHCNDPVRVRIVLPPLDVCLFPFAPALCGSSYIHVSIVLSFPLSDSGLFEQRVEQYLEELPDTEQSGMNKFLRGLGKLLVTDGDGQGELSPKIRLSQFFSIFLPFIHM